jgi:tetratricopeptide (TPR) repeat protein
MQKNSANPVDSNPQAQQRISIPEAFSAAMLLHKDNKLNEAQILLRRILAAAPRHAGAMHLLGVITHQHGDTKTAAQLIEDAIKIMPDEALFHANIGEMYRILKNLEASISHGEKAISLAPNNPNAHSNLGIAYYDSGQLDKAEACQKRALEIAPNLATALNNLGSIEHDKKNLAGATEYYKKAVAAAPNYIESISNLSSILTENEQPDEAIKLLLPLIQSNPNFADAHCNIGTAFLVKEDYDKAEFGFKRALALKKDYLEANIGLAKVLQEKRDYAGALHHAELANKLNPNKADVYSLIGGIFGEYGYPEKAKLNFAKALELDTKLVSAYLGRGHQLMESGDMKGAADDFKHALSLEPDNLAARLAIAQVNKVKPEDDNMAALITQASKIDTLPDAKAIPLHFGLGKCFEDTKQYDLAFKHYQAGCQLKRKRIEYSADNNDLITKNIMDVFSKENIDRLRGDACDSNLPIFVLGMPRSGTTLTETIIASHPMVYGAGELNDILEIAATALVTDTENTKQDLIGYPLNLKGITQAELKAMGERYITGLQARAPAFSRITDKMPANFNCLGLIHLMLPNAKIVHVRRNPVDTCLSCYTRLFNKSQLQSYDLQDIGRYYRNYATLMEHWRKVLPSGSFYEIQYEDIIADAEGQSRALIDYCGLTWDDACLEFHKTERNIRTASVTQVRQPIYKTSIEKWRHYEKHLGPLLDALGDLIKH